MTTNLAIRAPSAWVASDISRRDIAIDLDEIALDALAKWDRPVAEPPAPLVALAEKVMRQLNTGPGFAILSGWNVSDWTLEENHQRLLHFGGLLGRLRPQYLSGELVGHVAVQPGNGSRVGTTTSDIEALPHTEKGRPPGTPRVIGLLCVRPAVSGGESYLVSGHTLHNYLLEVAPDVVPRLYQDFIWGRHAEVYPDGLTIDREPVFRRTATALCVRYGRSWIPVGERSSGVPLDDDGHQALDAIDRVLGDEALHFGFRLEPGELVLINNRTVLHARRCFKDHADVSKGRLLLRIWLD